MFVCNASCGLLLVVVVDWIGSNRCSQLASLLDLCVVLCCAALCETFVRSTCSPFWCCCCCCSVAHSLLSIHAFIHALATRRLLSAAPSELHNDQDDNQQEKQPARRQTLLAKDKSCPVSVLLSLRFGSVCEREKRADAIAICSTLNPPVARLNELEPASQPARARANTWRVQCLAGWQLATSSHLMAHNSDERLEARKQSNWLFLQSSSTVDPLPTDKVSSGARGTCVRISGRCQRPGFNVAALAEPEAAAAAASAASAEEEPADEKLLVAQLKVCTKMGSIGRPLN